MAIAHLSIRVQSRSRGQSFARALAYRCGLHLVDSRTSRSYDYRRRVDREEIAHTGIGRYEGLDASWMLEHAQLLADRIDEAERRVNSIVARDFESAIPHELDDAQRLALAQEWSDFLSARYRAPVPFAVHYSALDGDRRNVHIHALVPDRAVADDGVTMGRKHRILGDVKRGPKEVLELRLRWQETVNRHLRAAGIDATIDMGRTRPADQPSVHAGPRRTGRERRRQRAATIAPDGRGVLARADARATPVTRRAANQATGATRPSAVDVETVDSTLPVPAARTVRKHRRRVRNRVPVSVAAPGVPEQWPEPQHPVTVEALHEAKRLAAEMDRVVLAALPSELVDIADHYRQGRVGAQSPRWLLTDPTAWNGDVDRRYDYVLKRADEQILYRGNHTTRMITRAMAWELSGDPLDSHDAVLDGARESLARTRDRSRGQRR